jgi:hypothetical protein
VLIAFLVLEGMVGMFNSCGATLRSRYVFLFCDILASFLALPVSSLLHPSFLSSFLASVSLFISRFHFSLSVLLAFVSLFVSFAFVS